MYQQTYYLDKSTQTFADVLAAYGLAAILDRIVRDAGQEVDIRIREQREGHSLGYYAVELEQPIQEEWVKRCAYFGDVPFILTGKIKQKGDFPQDISVTDYEKHKSSNAAYYEALKQLSKEARRARGSPDQNPELKAFQEQYTAPHPDWNIWAQVNQMSAISAYNKMVTAWHESRPCFTDLLRLILRMCAVFPNDVEGAMEAWKKLAKRHNLSGSPLAPATQVYNPATGKGSNRSKADALTIGGQSNFWLLEYLKLIGMPLAGLPRIVKESKDRKTYVLLPANITLSTSRQVFKQFRQLPRSSPVKMDVLAALRFTQAFLTQWRDGQMTRFKARRGGQPGDYVQGLGMVFYKDMGSAHAVLNQSVIGLPRWVDKVETKAEAQQFLGMLEEHEQVIRPLDEKRGLDYELLRTYRDFLSAHDLRHFFDFGASYSSFLTNKIENREYVNQFTTTNLEVLIMAQDKKLKPILESEGFQNVATAIRQSTVNPQRAKVSGKRVYDVRYGLGNDLKRKANNNEEFVQTLTDFMHRYNQENVQMEESHKGNPPFRRKQLTTTDINEVIALIDEYGARTVGNMLVAFGYARAPREEE